MSKSDLLVLCASLVACQPKDPSEKEHALPANPPDLLVTTNVQIELQVSNREQARSDIAAIATQMSGNVAEDDTDQMDIRVPSDNFEETIDILSNKVGVVLNIQVWAQDITEQYALLHNELEQLESRLEASPSETQDELEMEIDTIRGKMVFRLERAAYDTIVIHFHD